jgi:2-methylfumaryl-CoA isomerase
VTGQPLAGLRVVEVATFVAGPLGGMTLAQLGAEVIRIDPPGGAADHTRWPLTASGTSLYWAGLNKGKRSLCADFRSPESRELIARLIAESGPGGGIVLTNADRPWLSYEALSAVRPDLIHLRIEGRRDGSPAVDYTVNAAAGFPLVTGPQEYAGPVNHVLPAWDVACGLYAAVSILSAERHRRLTGQGQQLSLALDDVALATAGNLGFLAEAEVNQATRPRVGNHLYGSFARDFATRDGHRVMVVALTARRTCSPPPACRPPSRPSKPPWALTSPPSGTVSATAIPWLASCSAGSPSTTCATCTPLWPRRPPCGRFTAASVTWWTVTTCGPTR